MRLQFRQKFGGGSMDREKGCFEKFASLVSMKISSKITFGLVAMGINAPSIIGVLSAYCKVMRGRWENKGWRGCMISMFLRLSC